MICLKIKMGLNLKKAETMKSGGLEPVWDMNKKMALPKRSETKNKDEAKL